MLSIFGGGLGILGAVWAVRAINGALPPNLLPVPDVGVDGTVLLFALSMTVTTGVLSATNRSIRGDGREYHGFLQTDASINPGNSGGPLLNVNGELIGVNVAIRAGAQGIGFAIPGDTMLRVAAEMMSVRKRSGLVHGLVCGS